MQNMSYDHEIWSCIENVYILVLIIHQNDMQIYVWDLFWVFERDWEEEDSLACQSETGSDYCDPELGPNPICRPETFRKEDLN